MRRILRRLQRLINDLASVAIDYSDRLLLGVTELRLITAPGLSASIARRIGDIGEALRSCAGRPAWVLRGRDWSIGFIGEEKHCKLVRQRFFDDGVEMIRAGRIGILGLSRQTQHWLQNGVDLVVCEVSRTHPLRLTAPIRFAVPCWINQVFAIPDSPRDYLKGNEREALRRKITKFEKAGFAYRFTQSREDFDHFYFRMYRPFVRSRHGEFTSIAPYPIQFETFFAKGGLVQILDNGRPVAGMISHISGDTCFAIEGGVLDGDAELAHRGIDVYKNWCTMQWAHSRGARKLNLGGTRPFTSDGVFEFKRRWGTRVGQRQRPYSVLTFLANTLPPALQRRINEVGLICEMPGGVMDAVIVTDAVSPQELEVAAQVARARKNGLSGVLFVAPSHTLRVPVDTQTLADANACAEEPLGLKPDGEAELYLELNLKKASQGALSVEP